MLYLNLGQQQMASVVLQAGLCGEDLLYQIWVATPLKALTVLQRTLCGVSATWAIQASARCCLISRAPAAGASRPHMQGHTLLCGWPMQRGSALPKPAPILVLSKLMCPCPERGLLAAPHIRGGGAGWSPPY